MISAGHYLATEAGWSVLQAGGNAIDAGVAAGIALGIVHSDQVQFSGVAPMVIALAERDEVVTIAGLGAWPNAARLETLVAEHGSVPVGVLRTVVPAAPDAWILALERYGTMSFGDVASAAIRYARDGFTMHPVMAHYIDRYAESYRRWPQNAAIWLPGGRAPREGELFVQRDVAGALQYMVDEERAAAGRGGRAAGLAAARDAFYRGDLAQAMARYHREHAGWLTADDLASYRSTIEPPVRATFHDTEVLTCGAWCQGPVLLQMLALLEGIDLKALGHNTPAYAHVVTEAMKLAFADRDRYYGDPRVVRVPLETLLSPPYTDARRRLIREDRAWPEMPPPGDVPGFDDARGGSRPPALAETSTALPADTSYVCVVDAKGNVMSATPSDSSWDGPAIPGLGFVPSTRGSQSWAVPGHASSVAPGKRPRLTPNPALARRGSRWVMPFGAPGGDLQPQAMMQVFLNHTVFGMSVQEAVEAPRFVTHSFPGSFEPHPYFPGRLDVERGVGTATGDALAALGHRVEWLPDLSIATAGVCAIVADRDAGILYGGADPRRAARAMGW
jgi:gamma-glutamyltranspeptidase / glutathione hydrolase